MTRTNVALLALIVLELVVGSLLANRARNRPTPPRPDLSYFDAITAGELRQLSETGARSADEWSVLGEKYLATGYYPEAEACYRVASDIRNDDADLAFKHAFALERLGLAAEADGRYRDAIALGHPRSAECWYYSGRNRVLSDSDASVDFFMKAGDLPAARLELAKLLLKANGGRSTPDELQHLTNRFSRSHQPVALTYRIALRDGNAAMAERLADRFDRSPDRLPNPFDTEVAWLEKVRDATGLRRQQKAAIASVTTKRPDDALSDLNDVLVAGWSSEVADQLSEVQFKLGRTGVAVTVLEDAIEKNGPSMHLVWRLADAYAAVGRPADARRTWERAARLGTGPERKDLLLRLAELHDSAGERDRARQTRSAGLVATGIGLLDTDRLPRAYDALTQATALDPASADAWYWLGETCRAGGRTPEARSAYERCLQLNSDHGRAARAMKLLKN